MSKVISFTGHVYNKNGTIREIITYKENKLRIFCQLPGCHGYDVFTCLLVCINYINLPCLHLMSNLAFLLLSSFFPVGMYNFHFDHGYKSDCYSTNDVDFGPEIDTSCCINVTHCVGQRKVTAFLNTHI